MLCNLILNDKIIEKTINKKTWNKQQKNTLTKVKSQSGLIIQIYYLNHETETEMIPLKANPKKKQRN